MSEALVQHDHLGNLCLITPEIFDYFQMSVFAWYQECINTNDAPPNLYPLFNGSSGNSQQIINIFMDGFAQRYYREFGCPHPFSPEYTEYDHQKLAELFIRNFPKLRDEMIYDVKLVLDMFSLSYVWDATVEGGSACLQVNSSVIQIW